MATVDRRTAIAGAAAAIVAGFAPSTAEEIKPPRIEMQPSLGDAFTEIGTVGTFAMLDTGGGRIVVSDRERAETGFLPASTFKIPNSLIALETGVAADADSTMFPWDKVVRDFDAWNQDHTLRSAFKASAVPVYQDIARKIGPERMQHYVDEFDYGNRDISGAPLDTFWLNGRLRISAMQQIGFLQKLYRGVLPISERSQEIVRDIMYIEQSELGTMRGKTGTIGIGVAPGSKATLGWLVGWVDQGNKKPYIFAMNFDVREPRQLAQRLQITKTLLKRAILL
ncbi:MAG: class D beta-lactamase [Rhizobiales bacterium]|nr:class D beta-lactamase [Hyphomicrobiales bacterium]